MLGSSLYLVAIVLALGAAVSSAGHNLFISLGTERSRPMDAYFVVMTISTVVLVPAVVILYYPTYNLTPTAWLSFLTAGLVSTLGGMVCLYEGIRRIGASRTTPITAAHAIIATVLGIVFLGETLTAVHALGIVLVVVGVAVISWETSHGNPDGLSRRGVLVSLLFPFGAAVAFGWEPIFANYGFAEGTPAPVGLAIKTAAAWLGFVLYLGVKRNLPGRAMLESADFRWFALAGVGNTLFLIGYYLGLELAPVNVIVPIIITNTLFVVVLSALFMPRRLERVTWRLFAAATVVVIGAILVTTFA